MHPVLFRLFDEDFPSFYVLILTGALFAATLATVCADRIGERSEVMPYLAIVAAGTSLFGARLLHVVAEGRFWYYVHICADPSRVDLGLPEHLCRASSSNAWDSARGVCHPAVHDCLEWIAFWNGGHAFYGGLVGGSVGSVLFLRRAGFPIGKAADLAAIALPLAQTFGRMGCLLEGCCFGAQCSLPWAVSFPGDSPASHMQFEAGAISTPRGWSLPVHPTQLYEAAVTLGISAVALLWVHPRKRYDGQVCAISLALYATARFALEFLRRDVRGGAFGLSTSQLVGIGVVSFAALLHWRGLATARRRASDVK
jgi:phosphatidylglycerol:prolipoprotein diacylglycerol transferase